MRKAVQFTDELKQDAVAQIVERRYFVKAKGANTMLGQMNPVFF